MGDGTSSNINSRRIIFAGGGTAGHVAPALAVARDWVEKFPTDQFIFIGTETGLEMQLVPQAGFELLTINKVVAPRKINISLLTMPWRLMKTVNQSRQIIKGANLLIGFGGYVSAPAYLAAKIEKVPFVIHEANATVGWANRLGAWLTPYLAIAHPVTRGKFSRGEVTGMPLRADVLVAAESSRSDWATARRKAKEFFGLSSEHPCLVVLGGSQGSKFINEQVTQALPALVAQGVQILHSIGGRNELPLQSQNYKPVAYIEDMALAYLAADVVLARSGAVTCAEFGALGKYAIFIPLATGNGEQAKNANFLVEEGRAQVIYQNEFTSEWLVRNLPHALELSAKVKANEATNDLLAIQNIVELMKRAMATVKQP